MSIRETLSSYRIESIYHFTDKANLYSIEKYGIQSLFNIDTKQIHIKSDNKLGWSLSAFNLMVDFNDTQKISLECAFQGSKVFENNVQYDDLYFVESIKAKKDFISIVYKTKPMQLGFEF